MSALVDNIRTSLIGLKMPRALEALDHTVQRLERGEIGALEAIDALLGEEFTLRENRRAPAKAIWPRHSALPPSRPAGASIARRSPNWSRR